MDIIDRMIKQLNDSFVKSMEDHNIKSLLDGESLTVVKPKELDTGKAQNMAEDDFYFGVPYYKELIAEAGEDADGNVKPPDPKLPYGSCECGGEATYGKDAPHSTWCVKYKENR